VLNISDGKGNIFTVLIPRGHIEGMLVVMQRNETLRSNLLFYLVIEIRIHSHLYCSLCHLYTYSTYPKSQIANATLPETTQIYVCTNNDYELSN